MPTHLVKPGLNASTAAPVFSKQTSRGWDDVEFLQS